ncbi:Nucleolar protein (NOP16) involved in 60S ribosomal subunit biogenesis [Ceraceosorus bombacis]|uniref:Nucleolar protein 16 n=1 Tax=Ceraceosorus bombacis TaxID=401625 RepID=A0A0P1BHQ7_9BASI|nr:Nucleolar protein (NOP16) involved in 60S ribosomal subunit biogenesis [Ceraceosorus bombacis]
MAKPRQRRKSRSGNSNGASQNAKRNMKKRLHRAPAIKGPDVLRENWDKKLTPRQNFAKLGLLSDLRLRDSGGAESLKGLPLSITGSSRTFGAQSSSAAPVVRKGMGRITRDADGNAQVVEDEEEDEETPWGRPLDTFGHETVQMDERMYVMRAPTDNEDGNEGEDEDQRSTSEEVDDLAGGSQEAMRPLPEAAQGASAKTKVVESLEALAATARPVPRHQSILERSWLQRLVESHGDDVESMVVDKRGNPWQKTAGEIRRAIKKAGGVAAIRASL